MKEYYKLSEKDVRIDVAFFCGHLPRKQTVTPYRIGCNNMECAEKLCTKLQSCEQGYQEEQNASEGKNTLRMPFEFFFVTSTLENFEKRKFKAGEINVILKLRDDPIFMAI